jgi:hypothetical protein
LMLKKLEAGVGDDNLRGLRGLNKMGIR